MPARLLADCQLERSEVVANSRMNRERGLAGANSYEKELRFAPLEFLAQRADAATMVRWLDLCCGSGRALVEAAQQWEHAHCSRGIEMVGVEMVGIDLVGMFTGERLPETVRLVASSVQAFEPHGEFDLVTCVHGLHYLGDKLQAIARAVSWLGDDGLFAANLDLGNLRLENGRPTSRGLLAHFRRLGVQYNRRTKLVLVSGRRELRFPYAYLGADDRAGPNCTGQPAVNSLYRALRE